MPLYRKKASVNEIEQFGVRLPLPTDATDVPASSGLSYKLFDTYYDLMYDKNGWLIHLVSASGTVKAYSGMYVVNGSKTDRYPITAAKLAELYEAVNA